MELNLQSGAKLNIDVCRYECPSKQDKDDSSNIIIKNEFLASILDLNGSTRDRMKILTKIAEEEGITERNQHMNGKSKKCWMIKAGRVPPSIIEKLQAQNWLTDYYAIMAKNAEPKSKGRKQIKQCSRKSGKNVIKSKNLSSTIICKQLFSNLKLHKNFK